MIEIPEDVARLLVDGYDKWEDHGHVNLTYNGDLTLFNYTAQAHHKNIWSAFERMSRGLIINNKTGEIVACPFPKFFNWGQKDRPRGHLLEMEVTEKADGSLGILYRNNDQYFVATRGSFDGEQAKWATQFLNANYDLDDLDSRWTILFEIIYPGNRVVVNYQDREDLVLIGAIDRFTGEDLRFYPENPDNDNSLLELCRCYGFTGPETFCFNSIEAILAALEGLSYNEEGYVARFSCGTRIKFKGDKYLNAHRLIYNMSHKRVIEACATGTIDDILYLMPDEFHGEVGTMRDNIRASVRELLVRIERAWQVVRETDSRKQFAAHVTKNFADLAPYLFAKLDGADINKIERMIYKTGVTAPKNREGNS
jgi:RNA ligase